MTTPTAAEQTLLDTHPQRTDLYLSIYEPNLAMMCQTTGTYSSTNQLMNYCNVVSGSYTNVDDYYFQVCLVGTTPGADDIGRTWVRQIDATQIRFLESDHINWSSGLWLTILEYTEIIPVFPRIISNPANNEDVIFYKIWDIAYVNQNSNLGTFVCMGSHYAGFLEAGTGTVYWTSSGTSNVKGDGLTYLWEFEGGNPTGSTAAVPGYVNYTTAGNYRTILKTTATSGRVDTSIRYVSIHDRPGGAKPPFLRVDLTELGGSRDGGGYSARVRLRGDVSKTKIRDRALCIVFGEDWYGSTKQSISNNAQGRETIKFVGYIADGSIQYNYRDGWVEFEIISPTKLMQATECFSVSVEDSRAPTKWYELLSMTVKRALWHYYAWHSTVTMCNDFKFTATDKNIQYFDADRTSLYDAGNTLVDGALLGAMTSDKLGCIWVEDEPKAIDNASTRLPTAMTVDKWDWVGDPVIEERQNQEVAYIEMGGIQYEFTGSLSYAYLCGAPGLSPGYFGGVERIQGLALTSQDDLNSIAGNLYAWMNSRYPSVELKMRGNFSNFDIAPQEKIALNVASTDTPRGITFTNKAFAVRSVNWTWDARNGVFTPAINFAEITQGYDGDTILIPEIPPGSDGGGGTGTGGGGGENPPPPSTPILTQTFYLTVYHNGLFVGNANALNFIDDYYTGTY